MGPRIGVGDVVNIFQSIWAKLREPTISQGFICKLPPFDGHLDYASSPDIETCGSSSRRSSSTDARLQWYVQEKQGDGFLKLSLKRTEFCGQKNDDYFCGDNIPITTIDDGKYKPTQYEEFGYNPPEAAQSSSGHREDPPVDDRQANYSLSNVGESPEERPRQDSPTINLDDERGIFRGYADQPKLRMPRWRYDRLEPDAFHRYQPQMCIPPAPDSKLGFYSDHRDQNPAYNQGGREPSIVETSKNHPHQSLDDQYFQGQEMILDDPLEYQAATRGLSYEADSSPSLDSLLEMNDFEGEKSQFSNSRPGQEPPQSSHDIYQDATRSPSSPPELSNEQLEALTKDGPEVFPLHDRFGEYQQASFLPGFVPVVYTGMPDQLNPQDHSTGGLSFAIPRNDSAFSKFREIKYRISSRLRRF